MVGQTNNDSTVIGRYYLESVKIHGGIRGDMGTENSFIAEIHNLFFLKITHLNVIDYNSTLELNHGGVFWEWNVVKLGLKN